jgi:hypothetical protein
MSRQINKIKPYKRFVVLGDGQTEQYYLEHLKAIGGYKYSIRPLLFNSITIEKAALLIKDLLTDGYDMVIYLTDYDTIVNQCKEELFKKLTNKYKNSRRVMICETMPSIEFWFLLHYQKTTREFRNAEEVTCLLLKHIRGYSKEESFLRKSKWVEGLCSGGKQEKAIGFAADGLMQKDRGDAGSHFPYTKAHLAIDKFEKQKGISK